MPRPQKQLDEEILVKYFDLCDSDEFSNLTNKAQRTELFIFKYGFERWQVLLLGETTKRSYERMMQSHKLGQEVGFRGRKTLLSRSDEQKLYEIIEKKAESGSFCTGSQIIELVLLLSSFFLLLAFISIGGSFSSYQR